MVTLIPRGESCYPNPVIQKPSDLSDEDLDTVLALRLEEVNRLHRFQEFQENQPNVSQSINIISAGGAGANENQLFSANQNNGQGVNQVVQLIRVADLVGGPPQSGQLNNQKPSYYPQQQPQFQPQIQPQFQPQFQPQISNLNQPSTYYQPPQFSNFEQAPSNNYQQNQFGNFRQPQQFQPQIQPQFQPQFSGNLNQQPSNFQQFQNQRPQLENFEEAPYRQTQSFSDTFENQPQFENLEDLNSNVPLLNFNFNLAPQFDQSQTSVDREPTDSFNGML